MTDCLSPWGGHLPGWLCTLGGSRTVEDVKSLTGIGAGAVLGVLALSLAGIIYEWRRSGLTFRDWLDSLR
jgi:hypothetical protein